MSYKMDICVNGVAVSESFTFDTGSTGGLSLGERAAQNIGMEALPVLAETESFNNGLGGGKDIDGIICIDSIKLDGKTITSPSSYYSKYPTYQTSWFGMTIISQFNWFFDFKNQKYYMKTSGRYGKQEVDTTRAYTNIVFNTDGKGRFFIKRMLRCESCLTGIDAGNTVLHAKDSIGSDIPLDELVNSRKWMNKPVNLTFVKNDEEITKSIIIENVSLPCKK